MKFKELSLSIKPDRILLGRMLVDPKIEIQAHSLSNHGETIKFSFDGPDVDKHIADSQKSGA